MLLVREEEVAKCMLSRESKEAEDFCREIGAAQEKVAIEQLAIDGFAENPENRCYICKSIFVTNNIIKQ